MTSTNSSRAEYAGERALFYDSVATGIDGDVGFYVEEARSAGSPVLELGCGTGRILIPMAEAGLEVVVPVTTQELQARPVRACGEQIWVASPR